MAIQQDATEGRQARLDALIDELRAAEKRQLLKRGILLWNRAEAQKDIARRDAIPSEKIN